MNKGIMPWVGPLLHNINGAYIDDFCSSNFSAKRLNHRRVYRLHLTPEPSACKLLNALTTDCTPRSSPLPIDARRRHPTPVITPPLNC
ncbi:hypothetical protein L1987_44225 [Smallanthus sonchifolius]|uniref:Uncharacterized protein n=1 Tax=Smallanthus sonchifolius TaxID=185202 RepID=A0ACB9GPL2_9ASTR|nr:hypothetical protein L1987_44225 [Smallanthus sonchifolius]